MAEAGIVLVLAKDEDIDEKEEIVRDSVVDHTTMDDVPVGT